MGNLSKQDLYPHLTSDYLKENEKFNSKYNFASLASESAYRDWETDRKSTRLNSSHSAKSRMPSSA